jgi:hypothetical protein
MMLFVLFIILYKKLIGEYFGYENYLIVIYIYMSMYMNGKYKVISHLWKCARLNRVGIVGINILN